MAILPDTRPRISILYAEDDSVTRNLLGRMIPVQFPDVELFIAENGKIALEIFREHAPEIVITDINMPVLDGIRMAAEIKAIRPETVIIVVSAYSDTSYLLSAIELGVNHYVLKPIDHKKLFAVIDKSITTILLERRLSDQNSYIRKLSQAVEQSPSMVMITDARGTIEYANPRFCETTGYTLGELVGQTPRLLKSDLTAPDTYDTLWSTISAGSVWHGEFLNRKKNGELYWEAASISPVIDEQGAITHFVAVKEDITARKEAEQQIEILNTSLAARAAELEAANRELEAFNYTVSHDLRKPLTNINGYCQVILQLCADQLNDQSRRYLQEIYSGTLRMNKLIDTLLNFSHLSRTDMVWKEIDLSGIAKMIAAELKLSEPERQVTFSIAEGITANGDAGLLRVVLENLLGNAWKYTGRKESAVIEFGALENRTGSDCQIPNSELGNKVYYVRDNGAGFDMTKADQLFIPFHRLHHREEFTGHGIGLATVQRIIQRHGGRVWAEGEPDRGATFYFTLP
jgi:PAS domain S-box-containing protein